MDIEKLASAARIVLGNENQIKCVMRRAIAGTELCIGFFGGSITQGSKASGQERCYASLVWKWWSDTFPQSKFSLINAGIGGTTSFFGAVRVKEDLLEAHPDFVIIDFTVNDDNEPFCGETFEGVIRQSYGETALMILCNVYYDSGKNAETVHVPVAEYYEIPTVSMRESFWRMMREGGMAEEQFTQDHLHPNDWGHRMVANIIISQLVKIYNSLGKTQEENEEPIKFPSPMTSNRFEYAKRLQTFNCYPILKGFCADYREKRGLLDLWKRGWYARQEEDTITFEVEASCIAVQFMRSVRRKSPVAEAVVDGEQLNAVRLDGNFGEDWGDFLALERVLDKTDKGRHTLQVRIIEQGEEPFYLVSVITD